MVRLEQLKHWLNEFVIYDGILLSVYHYSTLLIMLVYYLSLFLLKKSLSIRYVILSTIFALSVTIIYFIWLFACEKLSDSASIDQETMLILSCILLIQFLPVISLACSRMPFVVDLFRTINIKAQFIIIIAVISIYSLCILCDVLNKSVEKIGSKMGPSGFIISHGLIIISGFLALGYNVLSLVKNLIGKILVWAAMIYIISMTSLCVVNSTIITNGWTDTVCQEVQS